MQAKEQYYKIAVWVKGRAKPFQGIRKFLVYGELDVHSVVRQGIVERYPGADILRIELELLDARTIELAKWQAKRKKRP